MLITRGAIECLFYFAKFQTIVNEEGVFFRGSFNKAVAFNWSLVDKAEIVKVDFVGYGTRSRPLGTVYNVAGDIGLSLIMKSGKKMVIGYPKAGRTNNVFNRDRQAALSLSLSICCN